MAVMVTACSRAKPLESTTAPDSGGPVSEAFLSPAEALRRVMLDQPRILAIGEMHAQEGAAPELSTVKRFERELLPHLQGARAIVIELWTPSGKCGAKELAVKKVNKEITASQAPTNSNEFLELGAAAKRIGIMPNALVPTCADLSGIADAGTNDVDAMLQAVGRVSERTARSLLDANPNGSIVMYGGALHNDLAPPRGRELWTFAPALLTASRGSYTELDLVIPEAIKDTDAWRAQPFYALYDRETMVSKTMLFHPSPRSWTIVFPRSMEPTKEPRLLKDAQ